MANKKQKPEWKHVPDAMGLICLAEINFLVCEKIYTDVLGDLVKKWPQWVQQKPGQDFLLLVANNAFFESISIIHTLVCSTKKEEVRIKPLLEAIIEKDRKVINRMTTTVVDKFAKQLSKDYPNPNFSDYAFLTRGDARAVGDIIADIRKKKRVDSGLKDLKTFKEKFEKYNFHKIRHQSAAHKNKLLESPAGAARLFIQADLIKKLGETVKMLKINAYFWFDYQLGNPHSQILTSLEGVIANKKSV